MIKLKKPEHRPTRPGPGHVLEPHLNRAITIFAFSKFKLGPFPKKKKYYFKKNAPNLS